MPLWFEEVLGGGAIGGPPGCSCWLRGIAGYEGELELVGSPEDGYAGEMG
jgi:hypothetical protein